MAILIGLIFILASVWAVLPFSFPFGLNWGAEVLAFLRGGVPVLVAFIGLMALFIGLADLKDKMTEKKEAAAEKASDNKSSQA